MTRRVILVSRAEQDIRSAFEWYAAQRSGLGDEFFVAVRSLLETVSRFPESNPILYRNVRRAVVSRFPYLVFYVVRPAVVTVLAVDWSRVRRIKDEDIKASSEHPETDATHIMRRIARQGLKPVSGKTS